MKTKIVIWLLLGLATNAYSQKKHDYNWLFGYGTGVPDSSSPYGGIIMSFNDGQISFIPQARDFEFNLQTNSFSDDFGVLMYMSNGCFLADSEAKILPNGDSLGYGKIWGVNCPKYQPAAQSCLFINFSNSEELVFFQTILDTIGNGQKAFRKCIYENIIVHSNDSVKSKNKIILYDTIYGGGFSAIPVDNSYKSWWGIAPARHNNEIYTFLYTQNGIEKINKQSIGKEHIALGSGGAQGLFSPNGRHYAFYSPLSGLQVFDFDRTTGLLSNFSFYEIVYPFNTSGGCAFSPDSRFVYVSNPTEVLQVDLMEQDSTKAIDTVGVFDDFFDPYPATYMQMALGPDCRIYITAGGGNQYLHVILYPNRKGKDCQLINRGLKLPTRNSHATPNFPHYRVDEPYPCDSTIRIQLNTDVDEAFKFRQGELLLYPNPAKSELIVQDIQNLIPGKVNIRLFSIQGQLISEMQTDNAGEEMRIPVLNLNTGMYIIQLRNEKGRYWMSKFLKD
ncbi:MAG: T9SS type A sorting domain-containing protein [Saprospiraceae bacterium]|nr:T9SS type A sorting domain-containing protein [Saprospiraceae bacterium]